MIIKKLSYQLSIAVFGVIFPVYILIQAFQGVSSLQEEVAYKKPLTELISDFSKAENSITSANDYALFSLMYVEHANQKTKTNKQVMKAVIVHAGFAVISVGMMLILLGINDGGLEGGAGLDALKFDFKTGSTGVGVFVIGAMMATAGGVLKNEYTTSKIPMYGGTWNEQHIKSINAYKSCYAKKEDKFEKCFVNKFYKINREHLK